MNPGGRLWASLKKVADRNNFATWARIPSSVKASSGETASVCSVAWSEQPIGGPKAPLAKEAIDVPLPQHGRVLEWTGGTPLYDHDRL